MPYGAVRSGHEGRGEAFGRTKNVSLLHTTGVLSSSNQIRLHVPHVSVVQVQSGSSPQAKSWHGSSTQAATPSVQQMGQHWPISYVKRQVEFWGGVQGTKEQSVSEGGGAALASEEATKKARAKRQMALKFPMMFCRCFGWDRWAMGCSQ